MNNFAVRLAAYCFIAVTYTFSAKAEEPLQFNRDIRPILSEHCYHCHGNDAHNRMADLRLDQREAALEAGAIIPGDAEASELFVRLSSDDETLIMPPPEANKPLTANQRDLLARWINEGANYEPHWAFVTPNAARIRSTLGPRNPGDTNAPSVPHTNSGWIDYFIADKLSQFGLQPSPQADPWTLLRRVSLDLVGVPPTPEEVVSFTKQYAVDPEGAYARVVERLLADPRYGEKWGRWWLDQARYADSNGYSIDAPRQIWKYRDWVVRSLNEDMPFDQFTVEQLAGDLLPNATESQRIATGFHRNTQINQEGGIDPEQFRIDSIFDRVATTGTVWLGLTVGCAQCHDHKYDPISQKEYYQLFAFLNNQDEPKLSGTDEGVNFETLILKERAKPRQTFVYVKGDFTRPSDEVFPGTPEILHNLDSIEADRERDEIPNRLDLAYWIVSEHNPLTARVIANRIWQQYFGTGIVSTENDFGLQGASPSHPELLDYLALELVRSDWSLKAYHRMVVHSHTYKQSSNFLPDLAKLDRENTLLGRQNRLRLDAELVRDVALQASGFLTSKMEGPSVFPPIPEGVMGQGQVKRNWTTSQGEDRYRRSLYTFVYRGSPPPVLSVFDAPEGLSSCTRRIRSNTPLQALSLLNDSGFVEFANGLARHIENERLSSVFVRCLGRNATPEELEILKAMPPFSAARALLNLDETVTRE